MNFFNRPIKPNQADDDVMLYSYRSSGDLAILAQLFEKYMSLIYGVCLKYLKDEDTAKDAVMGIFEELVAKVKQHDIKQFRSWVYVLSRNFCLMQMRSGKKAELISLDDVMEIASFLHPDDNSNEATLQALERCIKALPLKQMQSIDLFYIKQKCYKEVATLTGFNLNEVKSYIQNGKRSLKICMEENGGQRS